MYSHINKNIYIELNIMFNYGKSKDVHASGAGWLLT